jgi:predicted MFS family arabinose efflux permease
VPESSQPQGRRLDPAGQGLAILGLGALAFAVIEGARWGWRTPVILAAATLAPGSLMGFLALQRQSAGALVPLSLFRRRAFSAALAVAGLMTFGMYGMLFLLPVYLQAARGHSAFLVGIELLPVSLTFVVVSGLSGRLAQRFGLRRLMTAGMAAMGGGLLALGGLGAETPLALMVAGLFVVGIGLGLNTGPVMTVAVGSVLPARSGTASGLVNTARMVGATLGIAVLGALFAATAGQGTASAAAIAAGMRHAFLAGGAGELGGALIALVFVREEALLPRSD